MTPAICLKKGRRRAESQVARSRSKQEAHRTRQSSSEALIWTSKRQESTESTPQRFGVVQMRDDQDILEENTMAASSLTIKDRA